MKPLPFLAIFIAVGILTIPVRHYLFAYLIPDLIVGTVDGAFWMGAAFLLIRFGFVKPPRGDA